MIVFKRFAGHNNCPICNTKENKESTFVILDGTSDGHIAEAILVHIDCLNLRFNSEARVIYQKLSKEEK